MSQNTPEPDKYFYVIHGRVPGIVPRVLYRRSSRLRERTENKKIIKCPFCACRLTDVEISVRVDLYRHPSRTNISCHGYLKCNHCKNEVGIVLT